MFYTTLDQIQSINRKVVDTFIQHEGLRSAVNQYLDIQTDFAKKTIQVSVDTAAIVNKQISSLMAK